MQKRTVNEFFEKIKYLIFLITKETGVSSLEAFSLLAAFFNGEVYFPEKLKIECDDLEKNVLIKLPSEEKHFLFYDVFLNFLLKSIGINLKVENNKILDLLEIVLLELIFNNCIIFEYFAATGYFLNRLVTKNAKFVVTTINEQFSAIIKAMSTFLKRDLTIFITESVINLPVTADIVLTGLNKQITGDELQFILDSSSKKAVSISVVKSDFFKTAPTSLKERIACLITLNSPETYSDEAIIILKKQKQTKTTIFNIGDFNNEIKINELKQFIKEELKQ